MLLGDYFNIHYYAVKRTLASFSLGKGSPYIELKPEHSQCNACPHT